MTRPYCRNFWNGRQCVAFEWTCILQYSARVFLAQHLCHFSLSASIFLTWRRRNTTLHRKYFRKTFLLEVVVISPSIKPSLTVWSLVHHSYIYLLSLHVILCFISCIYIKFKCVPWKPWIWYQCVQWERMDWDKGESGAKESQFL